MSIERAGSADVLAGGDGEDMLKDGLGDDTLYGGDGADHINGFEAGDIIEGAGAPGGLRDLVIEQKGSHTVIR